MTTLLKLGPADDGRPMTEEELQAAHCAEGYQYELIRGRLYVSALPNLPQNIVERWLDREITGYGDRHPEIINYVTSKARVFVTGEAEVTAPEPDLAAYHDFPFHVPRAERDWRQISPILVAEIVSASNPDKDLVRNLELYLSVPSIREYWIIDPRPEGEPFHFLVHRRRGQRWQRVIELRKGDTYTTRLLPDLMLRLTPP